MIKERIKSFTLIILIIASFIEVGILWDYQGLGFPINFLRTLKDMKSIGQEKMVNKLRSDAIEPYRIIVSAGLEEPHWILNKGTDTQNEYDKLWVEGQYYLKSILNSENIQTEAYIPHKEWDELVVKKGIIFEFRSSFKPGSIAYFMDTSVSQPGDIESIQKVLLSPWDDINYNSFAVYLFDGNSRLKKYIINAKENNLKKDYYDELLVKLNQKTENNSLRNYSVIKETRNTVLYPARKDIPIIIEGSKFEPFSNINCLAPENLMTRSGNNFIEIEKKFESILGSGKDSYDISDDADGSITVKNLNNIYRFYSDGVLQYRNLSSLTDTERIYESQAYKNALEFIEKMKLLPANVDLFLSSIEEGRDKVKLTFDYKINGLPILFDYSMAGREKSILKNAITIEANNRRVISCWWILRSFEPLKEKIRYNVNFVDLMDKTFRDYPMLKTEKNFTLKDAAVGYEVRNDVETLKLEPLWFIYTEGGNRYPVKMVPKKGE